MKSVNMESVPDIPDVRHHSLRSHIFSVCPLKKRTKFH